MVSRRSAGLSKIWGAILILIIALGSLFILGNIFGGGPQEVATTPQIVERIKETPIIETATQPKETAVREMPQETTRIQVTTPKDRGGDAGEQATATETRTWTTALYEKISIGKIPYFTLSTDTPYIVLPEGKEITLNLRADSFNGYSGSIKLFIHSIWVSKDQAGCYAGKTGLSYENITKREGSLSKGYITMLGLDIPNPGIDVSFSSQEINVPGEAEIKISLPSDGVPECSYNIVISGIDRDGLMHSTVVTLSVVKNPSYIVRPLTSFIPALEPNSTYYIAMEVVPIGEYNRTVELDAKTQTTGHIYAEVKVKAINASGIPPFNFTLYIETGKIVKSGLLEGSVIVAVYDKNAEESPVYRFYLEAGITPEQRRGGLLSFLFQFLQIITLPVRFLFGLATGFITGSILLPLGVDLSEGLASGIQLFAPDLLAERLSIESFGGGSIVDGWVVTGVKSGLLGTNMSVSFVLPTRYIYVPCSREAELPFQIFYNDRVLSLSDIALTARINMGNYYTNEYFNIDIVSDGNPAVAILKIANLPDVIMAQRKPRIIQLLAYPKDSDFNISDPHIMRLWETYNWVNLYIVPSCPATEPSSAFVFLVPGAKTVVPFKTKLHNLRLIVFDSKDTYDGNISAKVYVFEGRVEPPNIIATPLSGVIYIEADEDTPVGLIGVGKKPYDYVEIIVKNPEALFGKGATFIKLQVVVGREPEK